MSAGSPLNVAYSINCNFIVYSDIRITLHMFSGYVAPRSFAFSGINRTVPRSPHFLTRRLRNANVLESTGDSAHEFSTYSDLLVELPRIE